MKNILFIYLKCLNLIYLNLKNKLIIGIIQQKKNYYQKKEYLLEINTEPTIFMIQTII